VSGRKLNYAMDSVEKCAGRVIVEL
jgi:hypothetical protein